MALAERLLAGQRTVTIPAALTGVVSELLRRMGQGETVAVLSAEQHLTTQEAADLLGVSRPHLVAQVLETGLLPFQMVGTHRRVKLSDLLEYREREQAQRRAALVELAKESERLGLAWEQ